MFFVLDLLPFRFASDTRVKMIAPIVSCTAAVVVALAIGCLPEVLAANAEEPERGPSMDDDEASRATRPLLRITF